MSSLDQRFLDALLAKVNKFHTQRRNESYEDYSGRIDHGGEESDNSYSILLQNGYDIAPSGLTDPKRKFKLVPTAPIVDVGSADGLSCGDSVIELISGGEDEEPALSGKENNRKGWKKRSSTHQEKVVVKKQRTSNSKALASMGSDDAYALQLAVANEKNEFLEKMLKGTYYYYCALFVVTLNSFLFLLLYPL